MSWDRRVLGGKLLCKHGISGKKDQIKHIWGLFTIYWELVNYIQQIGTGALFFINSYILGLIWGINCMYLIDSHSRNEKDTSPSTVQEFFKNWIHCAHQEIIYDQFIIMVTHQRSSFKCNLQKFLALSMPRVPFSLSAKWQRSLNAQEIKYHDDPEKKTGS